MKNGFGCSYLSTDEREERREGEYLLGSYSAVRAIGGSTYLAVK